MQGANRPSGTTARWVMLLLSLGILLHPQAQAGTVVGTVKYLGKPPTPRKAAISQDTEICGTEKQSAYLVVGPDQGIQWAVVQIADLTGAKSSAEPPVVDQKGCDFAPRVVIVRPGEEVAILNSDGILHNVHTRSKENPAVNKAQPGFVKRMPLTFKHAEVIRLKCDVHGWMTGWIMVTDSPHASVTDGAGSFRLSDVPAGTHQLTTWHEKLGEQSQEITVVDGQESRVVFEFSRE